MDIAAEEMTKKVSDIKLSRLESLLELSLRITSANSDPYKDDLRVKLFSIDLKTMIKKIQNVESHQDIKSDMNTELNGLSSFSMDYVVKWPLSLIINRKVYSNHMRSFEVNFKIFFFLFFYSDTLQVSDSVPSHISTKGRRAPALQVIETPLIHKKRFTKKLEFSI